MGMKLWEIDSSHRLDELLNQPAEWEWKRQDPREWVAKFTIDDVNYFVYLDGRDDDDVSITFTGNGSEQITGTGNSFTVFATVKDIISSFLKSRDPESLSFSAEEPSRAKLYSKLAKMIAKDFGGVARSYDADVQGTGFTIRLQEDVQLNEWGKIVPGVNTTQDVQPGEIQRQAEKFGNSLDSKGRPPLLSGSYGDDTARFSANQGDPLYGSDGKKIKASRK